MLIFYKDWKSTMKLTNKKQNGLEQSKNEKSSTLPRATEIKETFTVKYDQ